MADQKNTNPADHTNSSGQAGQVAGSHSGSSKDQVPKQHGHDGGDNLTNQPEKVLSGRFSPAAHLDRNRIRK